MAKVHAAVKEDISFVAKQWAKTQMVEVEACKQGAGRFADTLWDEWLEKANCGGFGAYGPVMDWAKTILGCKNILEKMM